MSSKLRFPSLLWCLTLLVALSLLPSSPASAQIGTTVDDFLLVPGYYSVGTAVATNSHGHLYAAGYGKAATGVEYWVVRKSVDGGGTWATVMTYRYPGGGSYNKAYAVAVDAADNVYVAGEASTAKNGLCWVVARSADGGNTWKVVDAPAPTGGDGAYGICATSGGAVYVVGKGGITSRKDSAHWLVRRSVDGGATWATVDNFQLAANVNAQPTAVAADAGGNVYVAGRAYTGTYSGTAGDNQRWIVRKGTASGASWATIDNFAYVPGQTVWPQAVAVDDASGSVYVTGYANETSTLGHALLRKASTSGGGFVTISDYQHEPGRTTTGWCLAIGPSGELVQGVKAAVSTGGGAWVIRSSYDGGATFQYQTSPGNGGVPRGLAKSGTSIFAIGSLSDAAGVEHWITRAF
jgi:hypothetical protein